MENKKKLISIFFLLTMIFTLNMKVYANDRFFKIQAIDTMKYSRDKAREGLSDAVIESQIRSIKETGATHVAIGTPYDPEFVPFTKKWVEIARKYGLLVWFRGNAAGWEKWFDYPQISEKEHTSIINTFILNNPDLFENGDVFTSCPECENGGPGDPRKTGNVNSFRDFLITEHHVADAAFQQINKDVITNYYSMNGDVARLVMDEDTTQKLGKVVTVDHYVKTTDQLVSDLSGMADKSKGDIVLGEWGAPIPDIQGSMNEKEQAKWIEEALLKMLKEPRIIALNYWTYADASTSLWNNDKPKKGAEILKKFYQPTQLEGIVTDTNDQPLSGVTVHSTYRSTETDEKGYYSLPVYNDLMVSFSKNGYRSINVGIPKNDKQQKSIHISLESDTSSFWNRLLRFLEFWKR